MNGIILIASFYERHNVRAATDLLWMPQLLSTPAGFLTSIHLPTKVLLPQSPRLCLSSGAEEFTWLTNVLFKEKSSLDCELIGPRGRQSTGTQTEKGWSCELCTCKRPSRSLRSTTFILPEHIFKRREIFESYFFKKKKWLFFHPSTVTLSPVDMSPPPHMYSQSLKPKLIGIVDRGSPQGKELFSFE